MLDIISGIILGSLLGIVTGLTPGLHINLVSTLFIFLFSADNIVFWTCLITAMAVSHNFFEFLPAMLLNVPQEGSLLSLNKSSDFVKNGRIIEAIKLTSIGALGSIFACLIAFQFLSSTLIFLQENFKQYIKLILLFIASNMIIRDKPKASLLVFVLSGVLGFVVLNSEVLNQPLLSLLTGLFGISSIISNLKKDVEFPKQMKSVFVDVGKKDILKGLFSGVLASIIVGFVPGLGPSQASVIATSISKSNNPRKYLIALGSVNTADIFMSVLALNLIGKPRLGAFAILQNFLVNVDIFVMITACLFAGIFAYLTIGKISVRYVSLIEKVNYKKLNITLLVFLCIFVFVFNGWLGLLVALVAALIGLITEEGDISKSHMMGVLIIPILFY